MRTPSGTMRTSDETAWDKPADFLSRDACQALFDKVVSLTNGGGVTMMTLVSRWSATVDWARNRVSLASVLRTTDLQIFRSIGGSYANVSTSRLDDDGLLEAVRYAERTSRIHQPSPEPISDPYIEEPILHPVLWSDGTYGFGSEPRLALAGALIDPAEAAGLMSAGTFRVMADGNATLTSDGMFRYYPTTSVECSMTVRDTKGTASGWAGVNHYDLAKIDPKALAARALDKAQRSAKPQAVEPGRFTAILEPQATADLFSAILGQPLDRRLAESGGMPFSSRVRDRSKIGELVLDRRLIMRADPMDPEGGFIPYERYTGAPYQPVSWVDQGYLRELAYNKQYALAQMGYSKALPDPGSFRLTAAPGVPTISVDEMIAKTARGVLVTRFSGTEIVDMHSLTCSGYTRDGLWLIEHGKISKAIKNFQFAESPTFVLNKLLDIGESVRVYAPGFAWIAPAVRVEDFNFTRLADAV